MASWESGSGYTRSENRDLQMYSMNSHCPLDPGAVDTVCVLTDVLYEFPLSLGHWCCGCSVCTYRCTL